MKIKIPYGKTNNSITINEEHEILLPNEVKEKNEKIIIESALKNPIDMDSFENFAKKSKKLLVIVNDATRPTPTSKILEFLSPILKSHPFVKFIIATGVHRAPTEEECKFIFGKTYNNFKNQIYVHDARKNDDMAYLGKSKNGT